MPRTEGAVVTGIELEDFWKLLLLGLRANVKGVDLAGVEVLDVASVDLPLLPGVLPGLFLITFPVPVVNVNCCRV